MHYTFFSLKFLKKFNQFIIIIVMYARRSVMSIQAQQKGFLKWKCIKSNCVLKGLYKLN